MELNSSLPMSTNRGSISADIALRDVIDSDLPIFFKHQSDPDASQMAAFPSRDRGAFMAHWSKIGRNDTNIIKTIVYGGEVAGNIVSFEQDGEREVGYWLGKEYWGKGIATSALSAFLSLERTRPLYGYVAKHNVGSRRVLEKCSFRIVSENAEEFILKLG